MKRAIDTSVGRVVLDFYGDSIVQVTLLDDDGWEVKEGEWGDAEVARGLFYIAGVPENEAEQIEADVLAEWRARGGDPQGRWEEGASGAATAVGVGAVAVGVVGSVVVGLVTIVRTIARWIG